MDSCLSTDLILCRIISKLNLRQKFGVQGVCRGWKNIAIQCLRHHEHLVVCYNPLYSWPCPACDKHPSLITVNDAIWGKQTDLEFWQRTLLLLQEVKYVYMDPRTDDECDYPFPNYKPILQLLINSCGQSLECLCIPRHRGPEDDTFLMNDSLPNLKHVLLKKTGDKETRNILNACPNLERLTFSTTFTDWKILPKGFKFLGRISDEFKGLIELLSSPAVETLEIIDGMLMTSEICYKPYCLTSLKKLSTSIEVETSKCLLHLARIVSCAPVLNELSLEIMTYEDIESDSCIKFLSQCQTVSKLTVDLSHFLEEPIKVSSWQDDFATTIVSKMKNLRHLYIGFHLSSQGLRSLAQLENLESFYHRIHTENMSYDSVFDTDALTDFLSSSLDNKLKDYHINIPISTVDPFGEYLILKESFYDFVEKMERKHFVRFYMRQDHRCFDTQSVHPDKIPGMIYVTDLQVYEWYLMDPELDNIDEDDIE